MYKVTVVIPNYNGVRFLPGCLDALLAQDPATPEYEVLVVDNGSTDDSLKLLRERYPQVRVEALPENTGFSGAVNTGLRLASTPYAILLNNDTKVRPSFVRNLYEAIENRPQAFCVGARMLRWDNPSLLDGAGDRYCVFGWAYARGKDRPAAAYASPCEVFSACAGAAVYRRSVFEEIGYFDEEHFAYLEDLDIGYRARLCGYRSYYEPMAEVLHYGSASSGSRYNEWKVSLAAANNIYLIGKNMPPLQWIWNLPFLLAGFLVKWFFFCAKGLGKPYLRGIGKGFAKLFSASGKAHRVRFRLKHIRNYFSVQGQLYLNALRFLKKS